MSRQIELKMVSQYIAYNYDGLPYWVNLRIGLPHPSLAPHELTPEERRLTAGWKRRADGIVALPKKLILIEGMVKPDPVHICRLELYELLVPHTPELAEHKWKPIEKQLVFPIEDPATTYLARRHNIKTVLFKPKWLAEIIETFPHRNRRASLTWPLP